MKQHSKPFPGDRFYKLQAFNQMYMYEMKACRTTSVYQINTFV